MTGQPRRYLIVDDNAPFAENLAEILRESGSETQIANSGAEALELLRASQFDALITDMRMPKLGGAELIRQAHRSDPGLPAIVVSAWTDEQDLRSAGETGLLAILPKPVPIERLLELLESARRDGLVAVVDDDASLVDNLSEVLRERGFSTVSARTLREVAEMAGVPFAALVDLRVPGGSDGAAVDLLHMQFPALPLFIITGFPSEANPGSADAIFVKPFDTGALMASLERLHRGPE